MAKRKKNIAKDNVSTNVETKTFIYIVVGKCDYLSEYSELANPVLGI